MKNKMTLAAILAAGMALGGCNEHKITKEQIYKEDSIKVEITTYGNVRLRDMDGDSKVDVILANGDGGPIYRQVFVAKGYEDRIERELTRPRVMSDGMRKSATRAFNSLKDLSYETAKFYGKVEESK